MTAEQWQKILKNARVSVVGLGISNRPLIDFLLEQGAHVTARDQKEREALGDLAEALEAKGVRLLCGVDYLKDLREEVIFRAPGIRPDIPAFCKALEGGAILSSEMELFLDLTPAFVIGITGSDGKTTTTTLTGLMLEAECKKSGQGRVFVGGNIGTPLLPRVGEMTAADFVVVELSSFQLQTMKRSPMRAAMTNISVNHLNWHTDMEEYVGAKTNIYRHGQNKLFVTNGENEVTARLAAKHEGRVTLFYGSAQDALEGRENASVFLRDGVICLRRDGREEPILRAGDILLPGKHNLENYMTAIALTEGLVSLESIYDVATTFGGVAHRLESVGVVDRVTYYNSSIDSTPTRTSAALSALAPKRPIVICGGYDKKTPYEPLAETLCRHAKAVVLTGASAPLIRRALEARDEVLRGALPFCEEPDFEKAVYLAKDMAGEGDIVLLSPACASFDAFKNFEERGDRFRNIVKNFQTEQETR